MQWTEPFEKEQMAKVLAYVTNQWKWERYRGRLLAHELGEANRKLYGSSQNLNESLTQIWLRRKSLRISRNWQIHNNQ